MDENISEDNVDAAPEHEKIIPKCRYFGECGGCSAQHVPYELQLKNKLNFVMSKLKKQTVELPENWTIGISNDKEYNYRNRMDLIFCNEGLGLRRKDKFYKIVPISRCEISNEKLNRFIVEINSWFEENKDSLDVFDIKAKSGTLKYALIRAPEFSDNSTISFVINIESSRAEEHIELLKKFSDKTSAKNVVISKVPAKLDESVSRDCYAVKGSIMLDEIFSGGMDTQSRFSHDYIFHSQGFFQNNSKVAQKMVEYTRDIFAEFGPEVTSNATLLDLYGGVGTFGIASANLFKECLVAEAFSESIDCAKINIEKNKLSNASAVCIDATYIKNSDETYKIISRAKDLFVLTDPPRSGMHPKTIRFLQEISPKVIVYVSCNPEQMAKELRFFRNYEIRSLRVFDMFPQTNHIESIIELVKARERKEFLS